MQQVFSDTRFNQLELPASVLAGIEAAGYQYCTPVQQKVLPLSLQGNNIAAQSQTGTGKTATFLITLLTRLVQNPQPPQASPSENGICRPRALILAPTRELVVQIGQEASIISAASGIRFQTIYGGIDYEKQRVALQKNTAQVIVATPGRLIDYQKQNVISLKGIEVLVIDEADRMFDMGFIPDVRWLLHRCSPAGQRQSLLFSATLSAKVMELAYEHLNISEAINITPEQITVEKIKQSLYHVGKDEKMALLFGLLRKEQPERSLIFTNTKRMAEILEGYLKANGYAAACLTGDIPQQKRQTTLERFKNKQLTILIATDVASRGLHIEAVTHVFNYDLPQDAEDYVHRIGRTARIGATGTAIALVGEEDAFYLEAIEKLADKIPVEWAEEEDFVRDFKRSQARPRSSASAGGRGRPETHRKSGDGRRPNRSTSPESRTSANKSRGKTAATLADKTRPDQETGFKKPEGISGAESGKTAGGRPRRRRPPRKSGETQTTSSRPAASGREQNRNVSKTPNPIVGAAPGSPAPPRQPVSPAPEKPKKTGFMAKLIKLFRKGAAGPHE
ncbi:MAG: DEAD/DEAH box helicase [Deltaproteobacteria bacterium]|nr:DEAD/DEAH box helicase [Deltaproteobacteria bacterium]